MAKFKVGDEVRYVGKCGKELRGDSVLTITKVDDAYHYSWAGYPSSTAVRDADNPKSDFAFELVRSADSPTLTITVNTLGTFDVSEEQHNKLTSLIQGNTMKPYEFNTSSPEAVDVNKIIRDLSWEHPLAKMEYISDEGTAYYIIVFEQLMHKAEELCIENPGSPFETYLHKLSDPSEYSAWKKWANKVRQASWPGPKGKVKVSFI